MKSRFGGTFLTPVLAIAGLVAAGAAGYRVLCGGCGACENKEANAALVAASEDHGDCGLCDGHKECSAHTVAATETTDGCCASKAAALTVAAEGKSECCMAKEAAVKTVAATEAGCCMAKDAANVKTVAATEKKEGCCSAKGEQSCKHGTEGCTGSGENGCCGKCGDEKKAEEKKAESVATSGK